MTPVTLRLRAPVATPIDASGLQVDRFVDLDEKAIAGLEVLAGRQSLPLGELFSVRGGRSSTVRIEGALTAVNGLGTGLASGELTIEGDAGHRVGAGMSGGRIHAHGSVGDDAGLSMKGGVFEIRGNAGARLGAAAPGAARGMSGGEIVVSGTAGAEAGMRARRGLIVIGADAGPDLARDIIAGTIVVLGRAGARPGTGSRRGTILAAGGVEVPSTYRLACTYEPTFVRLLMTYLVRQFGLAIGDNIISGRYRRYCGDAGLPGKGEILEWIGA
jgi:formylmethanofuran dehydrogenase subunit C